MSCKNRGIPQACPSEQSCIRNRRHDIRGKGNAGNHGASLELASMVFIELDSTLRRPQSHESRFFSTLPTYLVPVSNLVVDTI